MVDELDCPLGGEPTHSTEPTFDFTDADVYGPFVTDDCAVAAKYVDWPHGVSVELARIIVAIDAQLQQPGELTQEIPVLTDEEEATVIAAVLGKLDGTERTAVSALTGLSDQTLTDLGGLSQEVPQ
jgi:hypothetical protein